MSADWPPPLPLIDRFRRAPDYTLRQLAKHLRESGQAERLFTLLLDDSAWLDAKAERFGDDDGFLGDVALALGALSDPLDPVETHRLAQLHALRHVVAGRTSEWTDARLQALVALGDEHRALMYARLRRDPDARVRGFVALVREFAAAGRHPSALLTELRNAVVVADPRVRVEGAVALAEALAAVGDAWAAREALDACWGALSELPPSRTSTVVTNTALIIMAEGRELPQQQMHDRLDTILLPNRLRARVIGALIRTGTAEGAEELIGSLDSGGERVRLWSLLARVAEPDRAAAAHEKARATVEAAMDPALRAYGWCHLLPEDVRDRVREEVPRLVAEARECLRASTRFDIGRNERFDLYNAVVCVENLCLIATAAHAANESGLGVEVLEAAERILSEWPPRDPEDLSQLLGEQPLFYHEEYLGTERIVSDACYARAEDALLAIAVAHAATGHLDRALVLLLRFEHPFVSVAARFRVAREMARQGRGREAVDLVAEAQSLPLAETRDGPEFVWRTHYNAEVHTDSGLDTRGHVALLAVERLTTDGRLTEAGDLIDRAAGPDGDDPSLRARLLDVLARGYALLGAADVGRALLNESQRQGGTEQAKQSPLTLLQLVEVLAGAGRVAPAERLSREVPAEVRLDAVRFVTRAERARSPNSPAAARRVAAYEAEGLDGADEYSRSGHLAILGKVFNEVGATGDARRCVRSALAVAESMDNPGMRSAVLRTVAEAAHVVGDPATADRAFEVALTGLREIFPRWNTIPC